MKHIMPQEIEVWYLIPALRKTLAQIMVSEHKLSQKDVAGILGITESAVSQYVKGKRGGELHFSRDELKRIRSTAKRMIADEKHTLKHLYTLCTQLKKSTSSSICKIHRIHDKALPESCDVCFN